MFQVYRLSLQAPRVLDVTDLVAPPSPISH
jgi:hypothetical protein